MSNKLIKKVTCYFCDKEVEYTNECNQIWGKWVCPGCSKLIAGIVNNMLKEIEAEKENKNE